MQLQHLREGDYMNARRSIYWLLAILLLVVVVESSQAQMNGISSEWESLRPAGEEFTIQMPKNSTFEAGKFSHPKKELKKQLFFSTNAAGARFFFFFFFLTKTKPPPPFFFFIFKFFFLAFFNIFF